MTTDQQDEKDGMLSRRDVLKTGAALALTPSSAISSIAGEVAANAAATQVPSLIHMLIGAGFQVVPHMTLNSMPESERTLDRAIDTAKTLLKAKFENYARAVRLHEWLKNNATDETLKALSLRLIDATYDEECQKKWYETINLKSFLSTFDLITADNNHPDYLALIGQKMGNVSAKEIRELKCALSFMDKVDTPSHIIRQVITPLLFKVDKSKLPAGMQLIEEEEYKKLTSPRFPEKHMEAGKSLLSYAKTLARQHFSGAVLEETLHSIQEGFAKEMGIEFTAPSEKPHTEPVQENAIRPRFEPPKRRQKTHAPHTSDDMNTMLSYMENADHPFARRIWETRQKEDTHER